MTEEKPEDRNKGQQKPQAEPNGDAARVSESNVDTAPAVGADAAPGVVKGGTLGPDGDSRFPAQDSNRLDAMLENGRRPVFLSASRLVMVLVFCAIFWSFFAELDEVSVAQGEVVPSEKVKMVQHLEGGIVTRLLVQEGAIVKAGDTLAQLSLGTVGAGSKEMSVRIDGMQLSKLRLKAEIDGGGLRFPSELETTRVEMAGSERATFNARKAELRSTQAVILNQIQQRESEIKELKARKRAIVASLRLANERVGMSAGLLKRGLTPRMEHLELARERESLKGENEVLAQAVPRAIAALDEARSRLTGETEKFRTRAVEELNRVGVQIARLRETVREAADREKRTVIRSPIHGIVKNLKFNTIGGVVRPGESILEIVPIEDELVVQARLNTVDRGYVQKGQRAVVKIGTYDFIRYGGLEGVVTRIAADTNTDPNTGQPYYEVIVKTDKTYLGDEKGRLPISPGMTATIDIHTGTRNVMNYIVKPILKLKHEAFRER